MISTDIFRCDGGKKQFFDNLENVFVCAFQNTIRFKNKIPEHELNQHVFSFRLQILKYN